MDHVMQELEEQILEKEETIRTRLETTLTSKIMPPGLEPAPGTLGAHNHPGEKSPVHHGHPVESADHSLHSVSASAHGSPQGVVSPRHSHSHSPEGASRSSRREAGSIEGSSPSPPPGTPPLPEIGAVGEGDGGAVEHGGSKFAHKAKIVGHTAMLLGGDRRGLGLDGGAGEGAAAAVSPDGSAESMTPGSPDIREVASPGVTVSGGKAIWRPQVKMPKWAPKGGEDGFGLGYTGTVDVGAAAVYKEQLIALKADKDQRDEKERARKEAWERKEREMEQLRLAKELENTVSIAHVPRANTSPVPCELCTSPWKIAKLRRTDSNLIHWVSMGFRVQGLHSYWIHLVSINGRQR